MSASAITVPPAVDRAIHEALADREGGEVIVRTGSQVGRLYVCREAVAWVTCDTVRTRLRDILEEDAGIDREALNAVVGECQHTRKNFGETLLDWGLLDEETLRRYFLPFETSKGSEHFGIGLTAASILAGDMGTRLGLRSSEGTMTAWLAIPVAG